MNIAFVNSTHRWGGVKSWTLRVAAGLSRRGHGISFFLSPADPFARACRDAGFPVRPVRFGPDWNPWAVRRIQRALREDGVQVVVTNVSKDNRIAGPACRAQGIPVLQRVGRTGDIRDRFRVRWEQRRYVDRIVVPAESIRRDLARFPWMEADRRVEVVPNGVDLERFRPGRGAGKLRGELGVGAEVPLLVTTSQVVAVKGHAVLLDALAQLSPPRPVLAVVGTGSEIEPLSRKAEQLGLGGNVRFLGFRRDLDELLEDADVAVQPSLSDAEGFPNSVVEFLAKGKAVVATDQAGVPEAITDGVEGLLVTPGDAGEMTEALRRLLADAELRARLARNARRRAEREFGVDLMVDRVERLLAEMVP